MKLDICTEQIVVVYVLVPIDTRPSATTMMTQVWLRRYEPYYIKHILPNNHSTNYVQEISGSHQHTSFLVLLAAVHPQQWYCTKTWHNSMCTSRNILVTVVVSYLVENIVCTCVATIDKNTELHKAHIIVSWPNPKQWVIVHTSNFMMIIR